MSTIIKILISTPEGIENEGGIINTLCDSYNAIHLRKPNSEKEEVLSLLKQIKPIHYKKLVIHQHFDLIERYNLKGIHFPERNRNELSVNQLSEIRKSIKKRGMSLSTSFHTIVDLYEKGKYFDYAFICPVYESISKSGYSAKFSIEELKKCLASENIKTKVIALGGITTENVNETLSLGFDGFATGNYREVISGL